MSMGIMTSPIAYKTTFVKCTGQCSQLHMQCVDSNGCSSATSDLTMDSGGTLVIYSILDCLAGTCGVCSAIA